MMLFWLQMVNPSPNRPKHRFMHIFQGIACWIDFVAAFPQDCIIQESEENYSFHLFFLTRTVSRKSQATTFTWKIEAASAKINDDNNERSSPRMKWRWIPERQSARQSASNAKMFGNTPAVKWQNVYPEKLLRLPCSHIFTTPREN